MRVQAAELFTDDLIAADKLLDVVSGSAGGILGLLRLYRDARSDDVLRRAVKCGEHLLGQPRLGPEGRRSWVGQGSGPRGLNGMSHGAAGFAYALTSLAQATGRQEFAQAAAECVAFENSSYDAQRHNWPDLRDVGGLSWPCQWCHGAPGIGLARIATSKLGGMDDARLAADIENAVAGVMQGRLTGVDTLCCGALGGVEFFCEAGDALGRDELRALAAQRLTAVLQTAAAAGDYRWNSGKGRFNLGYVPRPCRRRLHIAAARRQCAAERVDLGIAKFWYRRSLIAELYCDFAAAHDATSTALNISNDWICTWHAVEGSGDR